MIAIVGEKINFELINSLPRRRININGVEYEVYDIEYDNKGYIYIWTVQGFVIKVKLCNGVIEELRFRNNSSDVILTSF
jgi:hypothetical protein